MTEKITMRPVQRWLSRAKANSPSDAEMFTRLYEHTHLSVFRYVYGLSGGPQQEAEDLTAETYARAWKNRQRFNGNDQAVIGWLLRVAKNLVIDRSRRHKVRDMEEEVNIEWLVDPRQLPELDVIDREQITILWQLLGSLPENTREILVLRYLLGWQVKQIAKYLGLSENNVSVTIRRTLQKLKQEWPQVQEKDNE